eukprot:scaffold287684_cov15-Tisochrysis_lutea.AAC.1
MCPPTGTSQILVLQRAPYEGAQALKVPVGRHFCKKHAKNRQLQASDRPLWECIKPVCRNAEKNGGRLITEGLSAPRLPGKKVEREWGTNFWFSQSSPDVTDNFYDMEYIDNSGEKEYLSAFVVPKGSKLVGKSVHKAGLWGMPGLLLVYVDKADGTQLDTVAPDYVLQVRAWSMFVLNPTDVLKCITTAFEARRVIFSKESFKAVEIFSIECAILSFMCHSCLMGSVSEFGVAAGGGHAV